MSPLFLEFYVMGVGVLLATTVVAFFATNAQTAGIDPPRIPRMLFAAGALLAVWFAGMTILVQVVDMGASVVPGGPPRLGLVFIGGGLLLFWLGLTSTLHRLVIDKMGQSYFMGIQTFRVAGGIFVIGMFYGQIPALFAIPAGLGDIAAGLMGWRAMKAVNRGDADARRKVVQANWVGLSDFAIALATGLMTADTVFQVVAHDSPNIVGQYPLILIPTFLVPVFLSAHFFSIRLLRQTNSKSSEPSHA
ncbi:hypothetical protein [Actibacterium mucosum]|uniref:hypothetical protein n=1 Tax=Actibacterium mucosum TaxID=1087332 RepID=UPI001267DDE3|nr:hypothetical protein [Actibacterium mucosum]